ncbi:MAG: hypothetical protein ACRC2O_16445 [Chitinophagaceae bacterium]
MKQLRLIFSAFMLIFATTAIAQHTKEHATENAHSMKGASRLSLGLGHTHISEGKVDGETQWLTTASWSFNYDYWISNKWAIGLQTDLIIETFIIENHEEELIERSYPWTFVPVAIFKPGKHLSIIAGVGAEFSKGHNLAMTRLGIEYGFHLPKNWEVGAALVWDEKWNYYNSWGIAFTVSKIWPKKGHHKIKS